ncbi:Conserved_hypothetical protein [Hexamita inflata]|uniref:Uncharacterized protein n=1 Tax=Hexamita inflata TaxID=28002 RepID=A0AA86R806_9EUKA|nr:Conserved hypothetical protein [Hexamita inflata]
MTETEKKPKENKFKKLIHDILNRKFIFEGKAIHPSDTVNVMRCLDITLIDYLNNDLGFKLHRTNGYKLFLMILQIFFTFMCIGVPSLLKVEWNKKSYLVAFAIFQWYAIMWFRYMKYERCERHLLQNKFGVKIISSLDRKRLVYQPEITIKGETVKLSMQLNDDFIFDKAGNFSKDKFIAKCQLVKQLVEKKTE